MSTQILWKLADAQISMTYTLKPTDTSFIIIKHKGDSFSLILVNEAC